MQESTSPLLTDLITSIGKYVEDRTFTKKEKTLSLRSFKQTLDKANAHKLKTGQFLDDVLITWNKVNTLEQETKEFLALSLMKILFDQTLFLDNQKKLKDINKSELLKASVEPLLKVFPSDQPLKTMQAKLMHLSKKISARQHTVDNLKSLNWKIALVGDLMMVPMMKENQLGSHPEKIDAAFNVLKWFLLAENPKDYLNVMLLIAEAIEASRAQGKMGRSRDLENALTLFAEEIIRTRIGIAATAFEPAQIANIIQMFAKKETVIPPILSLIEYASSDDQPFIEERKRCVETFFDFLNETEQKIDKKAFIAKYGELFKRTLKVLSNKEINVENYVKLYNHVVDASDQITTQNNKFRFSMKSEDVIDSSDEESSEETMSDIEEEKEEALKQEAPRISELFVFSINKTGVANVVANAKTSILFGNEYNYLNRLGYALSQNNQHNVNFWFNKLKEFSRFKDETDPQRLINKYKHCLPDQYAQQNTESKMNVFLLNNLPPKFPSSAIAREENIMVVPFEDIETFIKNIMDHKPDYVLSLGRLGVDFVNYTRSGKTIYGDCEVDVKEEVMTITHAKTKQSHRCMLLANIPVLENHSLNFSYHGAEQFLSLYHQMKNSAVLIHDTESIGRSAQAKLLLKGLAVLESDPKFKAAIDDLLAGNSMDENYVSTTMRLLLESSRKIRYSLHEEKQFTDTIKQLLLLRAKQLNCTHEKFSDLRKELVIDHATITKPKFGAKLLGASLSAVTHHVSKSIETGQVASLQNN